MLMKNGYQNNHLLLLEEDEKGNIVDFFIPGTQQYPEVTYKADFYRKSKCCWYLSKRTSTTLFNVS